MFQKTIPMAMSTLLLACAAENDKSPTSRVEVSVAALKLAGITDALYTIAVENGAGETVWSQSGLSSVRYGDGRGALTYVGPCDATSNPHRVTVTLDALYDDTGKLGPADWKNPGPMTRELDCVANQDRLVEFNLTVMRSANQGFFDIAVNFDDIFCSAKLDCLERPLLHNPTTGERDTTVVFAFACTAGTGEGTTLYLDDIQIACENGTYTVNPVVGPGNQGGQPPLLYQVATYWGREAFADLDKCYWNTSLGLDLSLAPPLDASCVLTARGTATSRPFADHATPSNTRWPIISWTVPLTDESGALICGNNPLDGETSGVVTGYTDTVEVFDHVYHCGENPGEHRCAGDAVVLNGEPLVFAEVAGGFTVKVGDTTSSPFPLPPGYTLNRCCVEECCDLE